MKAILLIVIALAVASAAVPNCATLNTADATKCAVCNTNFDQFGGACVASSCRLNLANLDATLFTCGFTSSVVNTATQYNGVVTVTGFNVDPACYTTSLKMVQGAATKVYTTTETNPSTNSLFSFVVPHADVLSMLCPSAPSTSAGNNYITYTCTFLFQVYMQGYEQITYNFSTTIAINTGVANSIQLTVTKLSATNTCCTIYTSVTSALTFVADAAGAASTTTSFAKNTYWFNKVAITDNAYAVYFLRHVTATLGGTDFYYTMTPATGFPVVSAGSSIYKFQATFATNAAVTLTITNTVATTAARELASPNLQTSSTGSMTVSDTASGVIAVFSAMLMVVLALLAF